MPKSSSVQLVQTHGNRVIPPAGTAALTVLGASFFSPVNAYHERMAASCRKYAAGMAPVQLKSRTLLTNVMRAALRCSARTG